MKYLAKIIVTFVLLSSLLSCTKEKDDSTNIKAEMFEFSLTVEGVRYVGTIRNNTITIVVPTNVNISHAKVEFSISEKTIIVPNPNEVDNWSQERVFYLEVQNGKSSNTYTYRIERSDVEQKGDVTLTTQSELEAFARKEINVVEGNLILGSNEDTSDPIVDLSSLSSLTKISSNIVIRKNFSATSLNGLKNLNSVGEIYVGTQEEAITTLKDFTIELPNLTLLSGLVVNCNNVKKISIPKVTTLSVLYINSNQLNQIELSALKKISSNGVITNFVGQKIDLSELEEVSGKLNITNIPSATEILLAKLTKVGEDLSLSTLLQVSKLQFSKLASVGGSLTIVDNTMLKEIKTPLLQNVGAIELANSTSSKFKKLDFPQLERVNGLMSFSSLPYIEKILVPKLTQAGSITLSNLGTLAELNLAKVTGIEEINLTGMGNLNFVAPVSITGSLTNSGFFPVSISGIKTVGGDVIANTTAYNIIIKDLEKIGGAFTLTSGADLESVELPDLKEAGKIDVIGSFSNCTIFKMPKLEKIVGDFDFRGMHVATNLDFGKLKNIGGSFIYYGATTKLFASRSKITNMDAFASLESVGNVEIKFAPKLVDFSGLKGVIPGLTADKWVVSNCSYNPTFQDMLDGKYTK